MTPTDIKESDIEKLKGIVEICAEKLLMNEQGGLFRVDSYNWQELLASTEFQQILQNQKDAQEYRKAFETSESIVIDLHKAIESLHEQVRSEKAKHQVLWADFQDLANENNRVKESCQKLQSQHKKLVDAIPKDTSFVILPHEYPKDSGHFIYGIFMNPFVTHTKTQNLADELQNLLKESEKE